MENAKKHYWGIAEGNNVLFSGSYNICWNELVKRYSDKTMAELAEKAICVCRIN